MSAHQGVGRQKQRKGDVSARGIRRLNEKGGFGRTEGGD